MDKFHTRAVCCVAFCSFCAARTAALAGPMCACPTLTPTVYSVYRVVCAPVRYRTLVFPMRHTQIHFVGRYNPHSLSAFVLCSVGVCRYWAGSWLLVARGVPVRSLAEGVLCFLRFPHSRARRARRVRVHAGRSTAPPSPRTARAPTTDLDLGCTAWCYTLRVRVYPLGPGTAASGPSALIARAPVALVRQG